MKVTRLFSFGVLVAGIAGCRTEPESRADPSSASSVLAVSNETVANASPSSDCERSYEQTKAVIEANPAMLAVPAEGAGPSGGSQPKHDADAPDAARASPNAQPPPRIELASRDVYLRDCAKLPPLVQKCLVFEYAMQNQAECVKARADYDNSQARAARP